MSAKAMCFSGDDNVRTPADIRDPAALLFDMLKKREHLPAVIGMPDGFHGRAVDRDEADPYTYAGDGAEAPAPLLLIHSVEPGSRIGSYRIDAEISSSLATLLGMVGAACYPIFGAVEDERKRERERVIRDARIRECLDRVQRAGRIAFHKIRKAASPDEKHEMIAELARRFNVTDTAIEECARQYRKPFLAKVSKRRAARIWRLHYEGLHDRNIADHPLVRVSITTVRNVLGKRKRRRIARRGAARYATERRAPHARAAAPRGSIDAGGVGHPPCST